MGKAQLRIIRDIVIIFFSILLAILLARSGTIEDFITLFQGSYVLTAFVAGILFTSIFTTAIGSAVFLVLGIDNFNPFIVALVGGLGALLGDLIIFKFVRNALIEDLQALLARKAKNRLERMKKNKVVSVCLAVIGGIIFASPFPDELGVVFIALSGVKQKYFSVISFVFNSLGILGMVYVGELL